MDYLLLLAFSVVVAMLYNYGGPRFYASKYGTRLQGSYAARSLSTGLVLFAAIVVASILMASAYKKPTLPSSV